MRVALIHYAANPVVGGVENVIRAHSRLMAHAGHRVRVIAGRGAQVDPEVEFTHVPLADSQAPEVLALKRALDAGSSPPAFHTLSREIEVQLRAALFGFEMLFVHNMCSLNKNLAATSALRRISDAGGPRLVLWHHDLAWTTPRYRSQLHDGDPWDLLRSDWPRVLQVTVSEARQQELAALFGVPVDRIRVIPNGIDPRLFLDVNSDTAVLAQQLGLLEADPVLLLPVRITPRKNIELAVHIVDHLRKQFPKVLLLVTGPVGPHNGENQKYLDSLVELGQSLGVQQRVQFLTLRQDGPLSDDAMRQLYRLADALLLPSREEGFGIPILEAGLARIPVFCSDISSLAELAREDGHYFPPNGDPADVAGTIAAVLSAERSHDLRKRILGQYTWERIYEVHLAPMLAGPLP